LDAFITHNAPHLQMPYLPIDGALSIDFDAASLAEITPMATKRCKH
jgi:hypothetical protein